MSAELWRSLQKEEKKTSYLIYTLFDIRPDTSPQKRFQWYQRNDEVGKRYFLSNLVKKSREDSMWSNVDLEHPPTARFSPEKVTIQGPQEEAASSSNQNPPAKCLRPCSNWSRSPAMRRGPKHQGSDMWFIQKWYPHCNQLGVLPRWNLQIVIIWVVSSMVICKTKVQCHTDVGEIGQHSFKRFFQKVTCIVRCLFAWIFNGHE